MADLDERVDDNPNTAFETADWPLRLVGVILIGILVFLTVAVFVLMGAFSRSVGDVSRRKTIEPPGPRLQTDPAEDLARFRAKEEKLLNTYYWIDKKKGIVHIPIARAMQEVARKGLPNFPKPKATP